MDLANPTVSDGKLKSLLWVYGANHNQFNSVWASETPPAMTMPRLGQEQVAKVHLGALAQALLLNRSGYREVLRDHSVAVDWVPAGADVVSQYQDPRRFFIQHHQEGLGPPQISSPAQGTVALDTLVAARQAKDLIGAFAPTNVITLRLEWSNPRARCLLRVDPATVPAERYKALVLRVGQAIEAKNAANRDQDFIIEVSSGSRTAAIPASSVHRLLYPDVVFGAGKIVMQTLRIPVKRLTKMGLHLSDLRALSLVFNQRQSGVLYFGDVQLSD